MVLILDVRGGPFWISSADIYGTMNTVDPVCNRHRGWLTVSS